MPGPAETTGVCHSIPSPSRMAPGPVSTTYTTNVGEHECSHQLFHTNTKQTNQLMTRILTAIQERHEQP